MKELGEFSQEEHQNINNQVRQLGFDLVLFYGDEFLDISNPSGKVCQSHNEIISILESTNLNNTTLLIKGSRSNKLEAIGNYLHRITSYNVCYTKLLRPIPKVMPTKTEPELAVNA